MDGERLGDPGVSVVIVNYNGGELLLDCLASLYARTRVPLQVILVDNASSDGSAPAALRRFPALELVANARNEGFARATNQGMALARAPYVLLLNPDVVVQPGAIDIVRAYMEEHPGVGICGPRVLLPSGDLDRPCRRSFKTSATYLYKCLGLTALFPRSRIFGRYYLGHLDERRTAEVDTVIGAFLMARRDLIETVGLLDERFFLYCEDEDWCWRARQSGYRVVYVADAVVVHHKSSSARRRPLRSLYLWHRALFQYHRKNIAPDYGWLTNGFVYAGMAAAFAARAALAVARPRHAGGSRVPRVRAATASALTSAASRDES